MRTLRELFTSNEFARFGFSTKGGVKPSLHKNDTLRSRIMPTPMPTFLRFPLTQQDGKLLNPQVNVGETVSKHECLAYPSSEIGVAIFAPTSGIIEGVFNYPIASAVNEESPHLVLRPDGMDNQAPTLSPLNHAENDSEDFINRLSSTGIAGMGGADYPLHLKLKHARRNECHSVIINAAECEPYICCDEALLREHAKEVILGATSLAKAVNAKQCFIAIEDSKQDAIEALKTAENFDQIRLVLLETKYPQGHEQQLVQAITKIPLPAKLRPTDRGFVIHNVGTAFAAYKATIEGLPCTSRITSVTGDAVQTPKNFIVPLGTPVPFLLQLCGVDTGRHQRTLIGGSMMGEELAREDVTVTRSTNCIIAKTEAAIPQKNQETACIRCGFCADACPIGLQPQLLYGFSRSQNHDQLEEHKLADCIDCGACSYICPSKIPLVHYFKGAKAELRDASIQRELSARWQDRFQFQQYRTKKRKDEALSRKSKSKTIVNATSATSSFSRDRAKVDIAAAVNRVKLKKLENKKQQ